MDVESSMQTKGCLPKVRQAAYILNITKELHMMSSLKSSKTHLPYHIIKPQMTMGFIKCSFICPVINLARGGNKRKLLTALY